MAHTFIKPTVIARRALAVLYNTTVLAALVHRAYDEEFTGKQGDTITIRTPATFEAKTFTRPTGIELQDATESSTTVTLDTLLDVSFPVTSEDLTLTIDDFDGRLLTPAMEAIVQKVDGILAEALVDAAEGGGGGGTATWSSSKPSTVFTGETGARAKLGRGKAPTMQRYALFSPEAAGVALTEELIVAADKSGWTDALREGSVGRIFGFDTYESQVLGYGAGDAGQADGVAFHRDAVALVTRTLEKPMGVAAEQMAVESYKGLGLRVVQEYDITQKQDVVSIDFLLGKKALRPQWAIQLSFGLGS
jgi:hypothetical protein